MPFSSTQTRSETSASEDETRSFSIIRKALQSQGISRKSRNIILKSWRESTKKQYDTYIKKWIHYSKRKDNPCRPSITTVLKFLTKLFEKGGKYSSMNTARSALSSFIRLCGGIDLSTSEIMSRFMKGVFNTRPALPRYQTTWDVGKVLKYLSNNSDLTLLQLSCKICMLLLLLTAQRCQTLHLLKVDDISFNRDSVTIHSRQLLKQSRPGMHLAPISLKAYENNQKLCIVTLLKEYIQRTKNLRCDDSLFISTVKPHKAASQNTISRWIKLTLSKANIDKQFKPHSTRAAAVSMASLKGVPLETIIKSAGWSNSSTFAKFYNRPIVSVNDILYKMQFYKQCVNRRYFVCK
jgi:integrase